MKIYKNWFKKFVQGYAPQKGNSKHSTFAGSNINDYASMHRANGRLNVSTQLPESFLHYLLNFLLAFSAVIIVKQLNIPWSFAIVLSLFIVFFSIFEVWKLRKQRMTMSRLQCVDHNWVLKYSLGTFEKLELQSISRGLGLLYLLNFVSKEGNNPIKICIWKYQTEANFLMYCSQLLLIGKKK